MRSSSDLFVRKCWTCSTESVRTVSESMCGCGVSLVSLVFEFLSEQRFGQKMVFMSDRRARFFLSKGLGKKWFSAALCAPVCFWSFFLLFSSFPYIDGRAGFQLLIAPLAKFDCSAHKAFVDYIQLQHEDQQTVPPPRATPAVDESSSI